MPYEVRDRRRRGIEIIKSHLRVTHFSQSLGAELFTNGNFASGTTGWTLSGTSPPDPEITVVAPTNLHGGGGTGAVNLFNLTGGASVPRMFQSVGAASSWYQFSADITARASGIMRLTDGFLISPSYSAVGTYKRLLLARNGDMHIYAQGAAPHNFTVDNASLGLITQNATSIFLPYGTFDFQFAPGTTYAGQLIGFRYRILSDSDFLLASYQRNVTNSAWDIFLESYASNVPTTLRTVTGVGTPDTVRVVVDVSENHQLYSGVAGVYTPRGAVVNSSLYNTSKGISAIYSPGTTPNELRAVV